MAYIGLFLTKEVFKWFKPYLTKYKVNRLSTANNKIKYIFLNWKGFYNGLIQIYSNLKVIIMAKYKLQELNKGLTIDYTIQF